MHIDLHVHFEPDTEVLSRLDVVLEKLNLIKGAIMVDLAALTANETELIGLFEGLLAEKTADQAKIADISAQLAAALAANDPVAAKAAQDAVDALAASMAAEIAKAKAAAPAPAAPAVPAPAPDAPIP